MADSYLRQSRSIELSTKYAIETAINANWTGITTVKTFLSAYDKTLPVVCVRLIDENVNRLEISANTLKYDYLFNIDIFATSDGQRLDLADFLIDFLKDSWVYYTWTHKSGDNSILEKSATGRLAVQEFTANHRVDFGDTETTNPDRFRHSIGIRVRKSS